jgi:hypothetical protein
VPSPSQSIFEIGSSNFLPGQASNHDPFIFASQMDGISVLLLVKNIYQGKNGE